jgi:hypothetical protein
VEGSRNFSLLESIQAGLGAPTASISSGTGGLVPETKQAEAAVVQRLRVSAVCSFLCAFMAYTRTSVPL